MHVFDREKELQRQLEEDGELDGGAQREDEKKKGAHTDEEEEEEEGDEEEESDEEGESEEESAEKKERQKNMTKEEKRKERDEHRKNVKVCVPSLSVLLPCSSFCFHFFALTTCLCNTGREEREAGKQDEKEGECVCVSVCGERAVGESDTVCVYNLCSPEI